MKIVLIGITISFVLICCGSAAYAQTPPPPGQDPPVLSIDENIFVLTALDTVWDLYHLQEL
jgi:hypothetical protein